MNSPSPTVLHKFIRAASFGVAAVVGFFVAEALIIAGLYAIFGELDVPNGTSSSPSLLALDLSALLIGVTVSFLLNERSTVGSFGGPVQDRDGALVRLGKFQAVSAFGNVVIILVQLALLSALGISPALGNLVGGVAAYPVSYLISIRVVWKT